MRKRMLSFAVVSVCGLLTQVGRPAVARENGHDDAEEGHPRPERTLYVWAGDQARVSPDFLAVIDFDSTLPELRPRAPHRADPASRQRGQRAAPLSPLRRRERPRLRRPAQPAARTRTASTSSTFATPATPLPVLHAGGPVEHRRRLPAPGEGRFPADLDGLGRGRRARPTGRDRQAPPHHPRVAGQPAGRRLQPARHRRAARDEPARHLRLRQPGLDAQRLLGRHGVPGCGPRLGHGATRDRAHRPDPRGDRHHGRQADPRRPARPRLHCRNVRRARLPRGHRQRDRPVRLRLRDDRSRTSRCRCPAA